MRGLLRGALVALSAVLVGALAAGATYAVTVEPGAAMVKAVFERSPEVTPPAGSTRPAEDVDQTHGVSLSTPGAPRATLDVFAPRGRAPGELPVVLWIHGGGFVSSSADTVEAYAVMLAHEGFVVASLDYTLAPGARHPVPVRQANAALGYLRRHAADFGGDASRTFIGGDSAGAQIASEVAAVETSPALAAADGIVPAIIPSSLRGVVLFCGLYDMATVAATGFPALRTYLWAYTGHRNWLDSPGIERLSTTRTVTNAYPPTFLSVGDADPFRSQEAELATALRTAGVPVTALTWNGTGDDLGHEYQFDFTLPQASTAFADTVRFLRTRAGRP